jgi:hypothetical protein
MKYLKLLSLIVFFQIFIGTSTKGYYFPMTELTVGKIYKYTCKADPSFTEYWKLSSNMEDNTLVTEAYNSKFIQYEYFKEKLTVEGSQLLEFISYRTDNKGYRIKTIINKPVELDVFKWDTKIPYTYSSETIEDYYGKVSFEKKRSFIGKVKIIVLGKEYKALKFKGIYTTEIPKTNEKHVYSQFSYYAKGLGLVKMEKEYSDGTKRILELTEIIPNSEWGIE